MNNNTKNQNMTQNIDRSNAPCYTAEDTQMYKTAEMPYLAGKDAAQYPEVYYMLQPHVIKMCDQLDAYGLLPSKENMENAAEQLQSDIIRTYPEMGNLQNGNGTSESMPAAREAITYGYGFGDGYGPGGYGPGGYGYDDRYGRGGFRPRGGLRDIIDILLLSEFYRRRRRPYY